MDLSYITAEDYATYFGETAPSNIGRLEYISKLIFDSVTVNPFPTPEEIAELSTDCQNNIKYAFMEQIHYLDSFPEADLELSNFSGGFRIGKYSESGGGSNYTGFASQRLAPNAKIALTACYELNLMYAGVNNRGC